MPRRRCCLFPVGLVLCCRLCAKLFLIYYLSSIDLRKMVSRQCQSPTKIYGTNGGLCLLPQREIQGNSYVLEYYPEINLSMSIAGSSLAAERSNTTSDSWHNVLVPVNEGVMKRIIRSYFEISFTHALNAQIAEYTFQMLEFFKSVKFKIFPHMKELGITSIAKHSETRDWNRSYIRCIVWHPNCFKIAVAGVDDIVRIYTDEPAIVPVLKSATQKWISSMAWRPFTSGELAVGCQKGICLWTIDNNMHITRSNSQAVFLNHPNHCPITSVQWNPNGTLLASTSIGDTDILIWNVDLQQNTILKRVGPPSSLLKWSPDGASLFSSTVGNVFRVWSCDKKWQPDRWTITAGSIQSASWSPCGGFLLFVTTEEPILYRLQFFEEQLFQTCSAPKQALPIADLSKISVGNREIGGQPQSIAWDPNGLYLAVTFKDTAAIVIFSTCLQKYNLNLSPCCFLTGIGEEYPSYICFQSKNRKNSDSVLTIGWSSGRIQYYPVANI